MTHYEYCAQFFSPQSYILDVGSGRGGFVCEVARHGFKVYGVEVNPAYVQEAVTLAKDEQVAPQFVQGQAEALPFPDRTFDFVNCSEVTEHVEYPRLVLREIFRVLKPGGRGYISFHNRFGWHDYHYNLYGINWLPRRTAELVLSMLGKQKNDLAAGRQKLTTMHYYRYGQVKELMTKMGFLITDIREEKIQKRCGGVLAFLVVIFYKCIRPFYFNTFHVLATKPVDSGAIVS